MGRIVIGTLVGPFLKGTVSGRTVSMFDQWSIDVGNASGPFSITDLDDWAELCSTLGVPNRQQVSLQVLFCLQTYFALISKMVALVILEGATGHQLVKELIESTTQNLYSVVPQLPIDNGCLKDYDLYPSTPLILIHTRPQHKRIPCWRWAVKDDRGHQNRQGNGVTGALFIRNGVNIIVKVNAICEHVWDGDTLRTNDI